MSDFLEEKREKYARNRLKLANQTSLIKTDIKNIPNVKYALSLLKSRARLTEIP